MKYKFSFTYPCPRKLREVAQISLLEKEPASSIINIWQLRHKDKSENVSGYLAKNQYELFNKQSNHSPLFILPVKREGGHFMLLGQVQQKSIMYCFMEDYKKYGSNSTPYFILTLFDELLFQKSLVLIRGDIINYKLNKNEAQQIMLQTLDSYTQQYLYEKFILNFNHDQNQFNYQEFCQHYQIQS